MGSSEITRRKYLIAGLGNPGKEYLNSRHNIGYRVVDELGCHMGLIFHRKFLLKGRLCHGLTESGMVYLLQPTTFMNASGEAVSRTMRKYEIGLENLLVIVDDIALPFGHLRLRTNSGSGGHNGLKSIEQSLGSMSYARLRIGVGDRERGDLASHVLAPFTPVESRLIPEIIGRAATVCTIWLTEGLTSAMNHANQGSSQPSGDE